MSKDCEPREFENGLVLWTKEVWISKTIVPVCQRYLYFGVLSSLNIFVQILLLNKWACGVRAASFTCPSTKSVLQWFPLWTTKRGSLKAPAFSAIHNKYCMHDFFQSLRRQAFVLLLVGNLSYYPNRSWPITEEFPSRPVRFIKRQRGFQAFVSHVWSRGFQVA